MNKTITKNVAIIISFMMILSLTVTSMPYNLFGITAIAADEGYSSAEDFLNSAYDTSNVTIYDGSTRNPEFYMNKYGFYQGLVFKDDATVSYNVDSVNSISFTMGHVDNSNTEYTSTVTIYLDDKKYDSFTLWWTMNLQKYELDVSDAKVLRIVVDNQRWDGSLFAFADFSVDSFNPEKTYSVPKYDNEIAFMNSGYSVYGTKVYEGFAKDSVFDMNGQSYYQGLVFTDDAGLCYNVENVEKISFKMGHVDGSNTQYTSTVTLYLDDKKYDTFVLVSDMETADYEIDASKNSVLRIVVDNQRWDGARFAFADVSIVTQDNEPIVGDCNGDGQFNVADVVLLQKWLLAVPDTHFANWQAADMCEDGKLDVFDLCLMKHKLING